MWCSLLPLSQRVSGTCRVCLVRYLLKPVWLSQQLGALDLLSCPVLQAQTAWPTNPILEKSNSAVATLESQLPSSKLRRCSLSRTLSTFYCTESLALANESGPQRGTTICHHQGFRVRREEGWCCYTPDHRQWIFTIQDAGTLLSLHCQQRRPTSRRHDVTRLVRKSPVLLQSTDYLGLGSHSTVYRLPSCQAVTQAYGNSGLVAPARKGLDNFLEA